MANGQDIFAKRSVVSAAGFTSTMRLLPEAVRHRYRLPLEVPNVQQSAGFIMLNIGIKATAAEIGATNTNTWHVRNLCSVRLSPENVYLSYCGYLCLQIPITQSGDAFEPLTKFFSDPLADDVEIPIFITFPSIKVRHSCMVSLEIVFIFKFP